MGFAWQVQQFRCLRDVVPWPYTCLLGRVASDRHWLFVAGAIFSMLPRSSLWPYFLFVWQVQYFRVLREVLRGLTFFLCGRCNIFDASEKFLRDPGPWSLVTPPPFCVAGAIFSMPSRSSPWHCERLLVTLAPFCVPGAIFSMPPRSSPWPYLPTFFLCGRCNIFDASEKFLRDPDPGVACDPTTFFCGRYQLFRCLREVPRDTAKGCLWPYLLVNNFAASWPYLPLGKSHKWLTFVTLKPWTQPQSPP